MQVNNSMYIGIAIVILYPFFFKKLANVSVGYKGNYLYGFDESICGKKFGYEGEDYRKCNEIEKIVQNKQRTYIFIILLVAGLLGVIIGSMLGKNGASFGLAAGGILTIIYAVFIHWNDFKEIHKVGITGATLAILVYVALNYNRLIEMYSLK